MTEGENLEQEFGQETASNMIDVESISSYGLDDIVNSKCGETFLCIGNYRVTSLEQLKLAEFSGEQTRPKVYVNGHKKVLDI